jgi:hypothetical protein
MYNPAQPSAEVARSCQICHCCCAHGQPRPHQAAEQGAARCSVPELAPLATGSPAARPQAVAPVAMTNVVNTALTRLYRATYFAQELVTASSDAERAAVYPIFKV